MVYFNLHVIVDSALESDPTIQEHIQSIYPSKMTLTKVERVSSTVVR